MNIQLWIKVVTGLYLLMEGLIDWKKKEIRRLPIICYALMVCLLMRIGKIGNVGVIMFGGIPGFCLIGLSLLTKGEIGLGDGLVVIGLGMGIGLMPCLFTLTLALILTSVYSCLLLAKSRANRKKRIAFIPFVFLSYLCLQYIGSV